MAKKSTILDLKELGQDVCDEALKALEEGAQIVTDEAKSRVPVKTGRLRDSIHFKKLNKGQKIRIIADAKDEKGFSYAPIIEFSPRINNPFMHDSLAARRAEVRQNIINAIREAVHKHAKR